MAQSCLQFTANH